MKTALPGSLPGAAAEAEALIKEARRRQRRRYLVAVLVIVVLAGVAAVLAGQAGTGGRPAVPAFIRASLGGAPAKYARAPAYYAYPVQGDIYRIGSPGGPQISESAERYIKIRVTATGRLLASVGPPRPYNEIIALTADAGGNTFVAAARALFERNAGYSPRLYVRDLRTPVKFLLLHITPRGHLQQAVLSLPETVMPAQAPTIALSPDGTRLAVALGGRGRTAMVQVITLATGQVRQWVLPHGPWTPVLSGQGAWSAGGRTLAVGQELFRPGEPGLTPYRPPGATRVRLLDVGGPGSSPAPGTLLVLRPPAGTQASGEPFLTPDGTRLIGPVRETLRMPFRDSHWSGELAVYSARTGVLLRTLTRWVWRWPGPPAHGGMPSQTVAWSSRTGSDLVVLQPRGDLNILGTLTGGAFSPAGSKLLPQTPSGYQALESALRGSYLAW